MDEATEGVVGDEGEVGERDSGHGTRGVARGEPRLDAGSVVGLTRGYGYRFGHELEGNGASEVVWNLN